MMCLTCKLIEENLLKLPYTFIYIDFLQELKQAQQADKLHLESLHDKKVVQTANIY